MLVLAGERLQPYRSDGRGSIAARSLMLANKLCDGKSELNHLVSEVQNLLYDVGYAPLCHYDIGRFHNTIEGAAICCDYMSRGNNVVLLEKIVFETSILKMHHHLHDGTPDRFFIYLLQNEPGLVPMLEFMRDYRLHDFRKDNAELLWGAIRLSQQEELKYSRLQHISAQRLMRAVNREDGLCQQMR